MITKNLRGQRSLWVPLGVVIVLLAIGGTYMWQQQKVNSLTQDKQSLERQLSTKTTPASTASNFQLKSSKNVSVFVYTPEVNSTVTSPILLLGQVPGNWSFEAQFPVTLKDQTGKVIGQATAQLHGDWMTDKLVPFTATINATLPSGQKGTLVLQKDNPSGLPANDDAVEFPLTF